MKQLFFLSLYYGFATWLPSQQFPLFGFFSNRLRRWCCGHLFSHCGKNLVVERGAYIGTGANIRVGNAVGIGKRFKIHNCSLTMGNEIIMAEDVLILGGKHCYGRLNIPIGKQNEGEKGSLTIEDDVWIGARVIIVPGCQHIGHGVVIGAGSVVTHNLPDYAVVAGNPAHVIKNRIEESIC